MTHKYLVDLTDEEQGYLYDGIRKGKTTARRVARAHEYAASGPPAVDQRLAHWPYRDADKVAEK